MDVIGIFKAHSPAFNLAIHEEHVTGCGDIDFDDEIGGCFLAEARRRLRRLQRVPVCSASTAPLLLAIALVTRAPSANHIYLSPS